MKEKIYFGHPINTYNTELEKFLLDEIRRFFPQSDIENPNQPIHQEGYMAYKKTQGNGMEYYFKEVLPSCSGGIFLPFRDGLFGAGVWGEAEFLSASSRPLWKINPDGGILPLRLEEMVMLSIKNTIARIRTVEGVSIPY